MRLGCQGGLHQVEEVSIVVDMAEEHTVEVDSLVGHIEVGIVEEDIQVEVEIVEDIEDIEAHAFLFTIRITYFLKSMNHTEANSCLQTSWQGCGH
jgi:hypothetical protein